MSGTIIALIAAFAVFLVFWLVLSRRKQQEDKPVTYVCTECGKKNCNCYRDDEIPKKQE